MAEAVYKGKRVEVEILTDTFKIRGMLFVPLTGKGGYSSRLSDLLNNPDKQFLALTNVKAEALPDADMKWEAPFLALNKNAVTMVRTIRSDGIGLRRRTIQSCAVPHQLKDSRSLE